MRTAHERIDGSAHMWEEEVNDLSFMGGHLVLVGGGGGGETSPSPPDPVTSPRWAVTILTHD